MTKEELRERIFVRWFMWICCAIALVATGFIHLVIVRKPFDAAMMFYAGYLNWCMSMTCLEEAEMLEKE